MAKYSLNNNKSLHCAILDENCIAGTYKVRFNNGTIRNVKKNRVYGLTRLDEGVLDRVKALGKKLLDKVISVGKYVYISLGGKKINTLFNVMINAEEKPGMSFYPSKRFIKVCNDAGVEPTETEDDSLDDADAKMVNAYWSKVMKRYNETSDEAVAAANESYRKSSYAYRQRLRLNEADEIKLAQDEKGGFHNVHTEEVQRMLLDQYREFLFDGAGMPGGSTPIPYLVWGAPGIGKTQIIKSMVYTMRKNKIDANFIALNARTMRRDDFALPGMDEKEIEVEDADGKYKTIKSRQAVESTKEWLPTYDPSDAVNGISVATLDDIANGGDGSGNGMGGFIFVDELSRVPGEVMEVFMGLVQDRQYGKRILGSKWMFVFAANRLSDMGERGEDVHWESAYTGRFSHINYVPTFREWLAWAQGKNRDGEPRIEPIIVDFLKEHQTMWYNSAMGNENFDDPVADSMYPNPRGWENVSKEIRSRKQGMQALRDKNNKAYDFMTKMYGVLGLKNNIDREDLSPKEMADIIRHNAGNKPATLFASWDGFEPRFTTEIAAKVWKMGDKTEIPFQVDGSTMNKAVTKILVSKPDYSRTDVEVTPEEMMNVAKYIVAMADEGDQGTGNIRSVLINQGWEVFVKGIRKEPYNINIIDARKAIKTPYAPVIRYIDNEINRTSTTVAQAFGDDDE